MSLDGKSTVLEWVEEYPHTEEIFRQYDSLVGTCILCQCLFDTIIDIEKRYKVDLSMLMDQLKKSV